MTNKIVSIFFFIKQIILHPKCSVSSTVTIGKPRASPLLYLGCNTVFDMRLRVTFLRRKTVSLQSNIAHRE
jgi:hypothetical protein